MVSMPYFGEAASHNAALLREVIAASRVLKQQEDWWLQQDGAAAPMRLLGWRLIWVIRSDLLQQARPDFGQLCSSSKQQLESSVAAMVATQHLKCSDNRSCKNMACNRAVGWTVVRYQTGQQRSKCQPWASLGQPCARSGANASCAVTPLQSYIDACKAFNKQAQSTHCCAGRLCVDGAERMTFTRSCFPGIWALQCPWRSTNVGCFWLVQGCLLKHLLEYQATAALHCQQQHQGSGREAQQVVLVQRNPEQHAA